MDWVQFERDIILLAQRIDFTPDLVVGISRGGVIPARLLLSYLGVNNLAFIRMRREQGNRVITSEILEDLSGKTVLLVDDMMESGGCIALAQDYLEKKGAIVKTAVLYSMTHSFVQPDYSLRVVDTVERFPWEVELSELRGF